MWNHVLICMWILKVVEGASPDCTFKVYRQYDKDTPKKLSNHVIHEFTARGQADCIQQCNSHDHCTSFNWKEDGNTCELNSADKDDFPDDYTTTASNWQYYGIDVGFQGQCQFVTCENEAVCKSTCTNRDNFVCLCTSGYTGRRCHISEDCLTPLGMSSGDISDGQILTSSAVASASNARLSDATGWSPSPTDASPWIKIKLLAVLEITGVIIKGGPGSGGWVTAFKLSFEDVMDSNKDVIYTHSSGDKQNFEGNFDLDTEVQHLLDPIIKTTALTFKIDTCEGTCSIRLEILGCKHQGCEKKIGWEIKSRCCPGTHTGGQTWITPIQFTCSGVVSAWRYRGDQQVAQSFTAIVFRETSPGSNVFEIIGMNTIPAGSTGRLVTYQVSENERMAVQEGDVIGFGWELTKPVVVHDNGGSDAFGLKYFKDLRPSTLSVGGQISNPTSTSSRSYSIHAITVSEQCSAPPAWEVKNRAWPGDHVGGQTWITPMQFTCHGVVSQWQYLAGRSKPFRALVLRKATNDGSLYTIVGINDIPAGLTGQVVTYQVPDNERIVVQQGDVIGFGWDDLPVVKHDRGGNEALTILYGSNVKPSTLLVNDQLPAYASTHLRAYSIKAIVSDWTLAFKGAAGNGREILTDWTQTGDFVNADNAQLISNTVDNFRDNFIYNTWNSIFVQKVKVTLLDSSGFVLNEFVFDAIGSTTSDWFVHSRVISTSWTDLTAASPNYFSLQGYPAVNRRFYMSANHGGCSVDAGWLCVKDGSGTCDWEQLQAGESFPIIFYSTTATKINWTTGSPGTRIDRVICAQINTLVL